MDPMDIDPRTHDFTRPRPVTEVLITIPLPPAFTIGDDAFANVIGKPISITHQPTGRTCKATLHTVTYRHTHTLTLTLHLPDDIPRHRDQWQLTRPPTFGIVQAPSPISPPPTTLTLNDIDITPYTHRPTL